MSADPAELHVVLNCRGRAIGVKVEADAAQRIARAALEMNGPARVAIYVPKADLDAAREELELAFERGRDAGREATSELIQRTQVKPLYDELQLARAVCEAAERLYLADQAFKKPEGFCTTFEVAELHHAQDALFAAVRAYKGEP